MIIQCPECSARYRTRVLPEGHAAIQVKCPKCTHQFLVSAEGGELAGPAPGQTTILLVDDARFFRELLLDLLKGCKANLVTADCAEDAWQKLHQQKVDLLIVDINLPDKNGLDLIREIRADAAINEVTILCMSGVYRKDEDMLMALRAGADDFISKSFKPDELHERIDKLLKK